MNEQIPGVFIPDEIIKRMEAAETAGNASEEGIQITLEIIEKIRNLHGVHGLHIMTVGWEEVVPRIVIEAGLQRGNLD
jgi:methylenetetrahydrofolate reductase (NADPH)